MPRLEFDGDEEVVATVISNGGDWSIYLMSADGDEEAALVANSENGDKCSLYVYTTGGQSVCVQRGNLFFQYAVDRIEHIFDGRKAV